MESIVHSVGWMSWISLVTVNGNNDTNVSKTWVFSTKSLEPYDQLWTQCTAVYWYESCMGVNPNYFASVLTTICEPGSSVGIATELRAGRSGIESQWGRDFPPVQTGPGAHQASCKMGTGSLPAVKCGRGVLLTTHPLLVPRSWNSRAIPLPTLWATPGL